MEDDAAGRSFDRHARAGALLVLLISFGAFFVTSPLVVWDTGLFSQLCPLFSDQGFLDGMYGSFFLALLGLALAGTVLALERGHRAFPGASSVWGARCTRSDAPCSCPARWEPCQLVRVWGLRAVCAWRWGRPRSPRSGAWSFPVSRFAPPCFAFPWHAGSPELWGLRMRRGFCPVCPLCSSASSWRDSLHRCREDTPGPPQRRPLARPKTRRPTSVVIAGHRTTTLTRRRAQGFGGRCAPLWPSPGVNSTDGLIGLVEERTGGARPRL